jgi:hypothetical protein
MENSHQRNKGESFQENKSVEVPGWNEMGSGPGNAA